MKMKMMLLLANATSDAMRAKIEDCLLIELIFVLRCKGGRNEFGSCSLRLLKVMRANVKAVWWLSGKRTLSKL
jgi:hypothetical protein